MRNGAPNPKKIAGMGRRCSAKGNKKLGSQISTAKDPKNTFGVSQGPTFTKHTLLYITACAL